MSCSPTSPSLSSSSNIPAEVTGTLEALSGAIWEVHYSVDVEADGQVTISETTFLPL